eukprot:TRINITY_DN70876_c0_g1_i1.p1 TRINITY_DN70876_c0_g1~~TRINITY_DN70876_c0_g1_i1.p1  ORF type:complete len:1168 (-),score=237.71 TRINITY_DN70876_c0_g1_i1:799-4302(-)
MPPSAEQALPSFVLDYLTKRGYTNAVQGMRMDQHRKREQPIALTFLDTPNPFLCKWFALFWDVYSSSLVQRTPIPPHHMHPQQPTPPQQQPQQPHQLHHNPNIPQHPSHNLLAAQPQMHPNPSEVDPTQPAPHPTHTPAVAQQSAFFANAARQRQPAHVLPPHLRNLSSQQLSAAMRNNHPAILSRQMRREDPRRALPLQMTPNSLQLDSSLTNPLASDLIVDPNNIDTVLTPATNPRNDAVAAHAVDLAAAAAAEAAAANNPRNAMSRMQSRVRASAPSPMRVPTPPNSKSRAYALPPGLSNDAASSASRRGPMDHTSAQRAYECAVQDDSQPRTNPNATSSTMLSRKRTAHHLPPKSPASSPNDNSSSRMQFSASESATPVKRRRSYSGYPPANSVSPRVAHQLSQPQPPQQQQQHPPSQQPQQQQPQQQHSQQQPQQAQQRQQPQQQQHQQQPSQQQQPQQQPNHHHQQQQQQQHSQQQPQTQQQQPNQQQQPQTQSQTQQHQQIQQQSHPQPNASQQISAIDLENLSKSQSQQPSMQPQHSQQLLMRQRQMTAPAVAASRNDQRYLGHEAASRNGMRLTPRSNALAHSLAQDLQKRRDAYPAAHAASRNPAHAIEQDSAKMNVEGNSLQTFRMGDATLTMSQPLQAHSQALPNASGSRVSAPPGFMMPNNRISLDMSSSGFAYLPCMDGKDLTGILPQNAIVSGVNPSMLNLGNAASIGGLTKKAQGNSRAQSRSLKNEKSASKQSRTGGDKPSEDMSIALQRGAQRLCDGSIQKDNVDALTKMKAETNASQKSSANVQSNNAKSLASNQAANSIDAQDASRARLVHESAKVKSSNGLPPTGSMANTLPVKTKANEDVETESRSTKGERHPPLNRASTPSQKSTASGGSNAVEKRASQGSGTSKRARKNTKARSTSSGKRSRADRGQLARNLSRNSVGAQTPRSTVTDVKNASSVSAKMKAPSRSMPVERSNPLLHVNSVIGAVTDPSQSFDKRRQIKGEGNSKPRTPATRQAGEEPKLAYETAVEKGSDHGAHDPQHGRQSPNALAASGPAQLFDMLQPSSGGARSMDNAGLDHVDGISQFGIVTGSHNGKVNGGNGTNYPYELQPFLSAGVEDEQMLSNIGNIGSMLNNMQDAVDLGSTDFEDDSLLGPADPGDLIGRNRA